MLFGVWIVAQLALIAIAVIDPRLASTFARASFAGIGVVGGLLTLFLALRGQDRALSLIPTWVLLIVWVFAVSVTLTGRLAGDVVVSGLVAGLVLITVLIGFTVTQFAFRSLEPLYGAAPSEQQLRSLAIESSGAAVWEWQARRDEIKVSSSVEAQLGLNAGELSTKVEDFAKHLHPSDRERFRLLLWSVQERGGGEIRVEFRMRHADNSFRWFDLEAAAVPMTDRRALRCVGLLREITDAKRAQERLLHDAVHDNLTGLPNRELFLDRLVVAFTRAKAEPNIRPAVLLIDIDKFKSVNSSFGLTIGDSLLLTVARRLARNISTTDSLARLGGNQFAIVLLDGRSLQDLGMTAERIRRSLRAPIKIAGHDVVLTGSIGIAIYDGKEATSEELLKEAEIAMYRAKRGGADRIEMFRPEYRADVDDRIAIESDLRRAIDKKQIRVLFQPIIALATEELAGFEALVRWEHPKLGMLNPIDFIPVAEESDLIVKLGSHVLSRAVHEAARWQKELPRTDKPLFVSVNVSSRQLFRQDLIQEIRHIIGRAVLPAGALRLEITESLVMENPEQASEILEWLRGAGAGLSMDDFGTGYSSLSYLQRFPFDTIKIDRDLVQTSGSDGSGSAIVRSIVALAHELGKKIVAEGVEQATDVGFLRSIGCEYAQGFYYGEAMPDREVIQLLKIIRKSERKLQRRGFFRTKTKANGRAHRPVAAPGAEARLSGAHAGANGSIGALQGASAAAAFQIGGTGAARPRGGSQLPASTIRPRPKPPEPAPRWHANPAMSANPVSSGPPPIRPVGLRGQNFGDAGGVNAMVSAISQAAEGLAGDPGQAPDYARHGATPGPLAPLPPLPFQQTQQPAHNVPGMLTGLQPRPAPEMPQPMSPNLSTLPPAIAASLARLAGVQVPKATGTDPSAGGPAGDDRNGPNGIKPGKTSVG